MRYVLPAVVLMACSSSPPVGTRPHTPNQCGIPASFTLHDHFTGKYLNTDPRNPCWDEPSDRDRTVKVEVDWPLDGGLSWVEDGIPARSAYGTITPTGCVISVEVSVDAGAHYRCFSHGIGYVSDAGTFTEELGQVESPLTDRCKQAGAWSTCTFDLITDVPSSDPVDAGP